MKAVIDGWSANELPRADRVQHCALRRRLEPGGAARDRRRQDAEGSDAGSREDVPVAPVGRLRAAGTARPRLPTRSMPIDPRSSWYPYRFVLPVLAVEIAVRRACRSRSASTTACTASTTSSSRASSASTTTSRCSPRRWCARASRRRAIFSVFSLALTFGVGLALALYLERDTRLQRVRARGGARALHDLDAGRLAAAEVDLLASDARRHDAGARAASACGDVEHPRRSQRRRWPRWSSTRCGATAPSR